MIARAIRGGDADLNRQRVVRVGRDRVAERRQLGKGIGPIVVDHYPPLIGVAKLRVAERVRRSIPCGARRGKSDGPRIARAKIGAQSAFQNDHSSRRRLVVEL